MPTDHQTGTLLTAIATDISHAERLLSDRRTSDGDWSEETDPVLAEMVDDLCGTLRSCRDAIEQGLQVENARLRRIIARAEAAAIDGDVVAVLDATARVRLGVRDAD